MKITEKIDKIKMNCPTTSFIFSCIPAPLYCEINEVPATTNPNPKEERKKTNGKVIPATDTAFRAFSPNFPNQNASVRL